MTTHSQEQLLQCFDYEIAQHLKYHFIHFFQSKYNLRQKITFHRDYSLDISIDILQARISRKFAPPVQRYLDFLVCFLRTKVPECLCYIILDYVFELPRNDLVKTFPDVQRVLSVYCFGTLTKSAKKLCVRLPKCDSPYLAKKTESSTVFKLLLNWIRIMPDWWDYPKKVIKDTFGNILRQDPSCVHPICTKYLWQTILEVETAVPCPKEACAIMNLLYVDKTELHAVEYLVMKIGESRQVPFATITVPHNLSICELQSLLAQNFAEVCVSLTYSL